jgi:hypothetical protein
MRSLLFGAVIKSALCYGFGGGAGGQKASMNGSPKGSVCEPLNQPDRAGVSVSVASVYRFTDLVCSPKYEHMEGM